MLAYFPFGTGPRMCIGEGFAWTEATLLLAGAILATAEPALGATHTFGDLPPAIALRLVNTVLRGSL